MDLLCVAGLDGRLRRFNPAFERVLGWSAAELLARPIVDFVHQDDLGATLDGLSMLSRGQPIVHLENRFLCRDGSFRWLAWSSSAPEDGLVYAVGRDVTERVRERQRRDAVLRVARRFVAEADPRRLLDMLLEETVHLLGVDAAAVYRWDDAHRLLEPVRSTLGEDSPLPPVPPGRGAIGRAVAERAPVVIHDYPRQPNTVPAFLRIGVQASTAVPVAEEGRTLGALWVGSFRPGARFAPDDVEVLELLAATAAASLIGLERAQLEGVLLAARTAEHEINNRLALTVGFTELLAEHPAMPPDLRPMALDAHEGAEAAAEIVRRLRTVMRVAETDWGPQGSPTIDLGRSASPPAGPGT